MNLAMLGNDYRYAYAPISANGSNYVRPGMGCYLGQDTGEKTYPVTQAVLTDLIKILPDTVRAIQGDPTKTDAQKQAELLRIANEKGLTGSWLERNQAMIIAGGVLVLVALVAVQTTKKRRSRRR